VQTRIRNNPPSVTMPDGRLTNVAAADVPIGVDPTAPRARGSGAAFGVSVIADTNF